MNKLAFLVVSLEWIFAAIDRYREKRANGTLGISVVGLLIRLKMRANHLTYSRLAFAVVIIGIMAHNGLNGYDARFSVEQRYWLIGMFAAACLSDLLDGPLARERRRLGLPESSNGVHLDPLLDKVLTLPVLVYYLPFLGWIGGAIAFLSVTGDIGSSMIRKRAERELIRLPSNIFGRAKMVFICAAVFALFLWFPEHDDLFIALLTASLVCGAIVWAGTTFLTNSSCATNLRAGKQNRHSGKTHFARGSRHLSGAALFRSLPLIQLRHAKTLQHINQKSGGISTYQTGKSWAIYLRPNGL